MDRFHTLIHSADGPAAMVTDDGKASHLFWLHVGNRAAIRDAVFAGHRGSGVIAWVGGRVQMEIEAGHDAMMTQAFDEFVLACHAMVSNNPNAAA
jgi:hypothetical protein